MLKKDYKARVIVIFCVFVIFFAIIVLRLFVLQIQQKNFFSHLAQHQYRVDVTINAERGEFFDRKGRLLALNQEVPSAFLLPMQGKNIEKIKFFLKEFYPDIFNRIEQQSERQFLWLERKLSTQRYDTLIARAQRFDIVEDIHFLNEPQRFYPHHEMAHVLGFTDIDNRGIAGLELSYDQSLCGVATMVNIAKEARSKELYFAKTIKQQGCAGTSVTLTLDATLQFLAYQELEKVAKQYNAQAGAVLIMNPDNGEILAMVNYPLFDPHESPISLDITKNSMVTECYELGSVFKIFAGLSALEQNAVAFDEIVDCQGNVAYINGFRVENPKEVYELPFHDVIRYSSNIGIAKIMQRVGPVFYRHLLNCGFGKKTGIIFPGEREGFVNPPHKWSRSSLIVMSFGYEVMASLLQLGVAFSMIANGGHLVKPTLVKNDTLVDCPEPPLYRADSLEKIKNILELIGKNYQVSGYRTMGKTGTARLVKDGVYSTTSHLYTFSGIVEKDNYRRVVITFIREPEKSHYWASQITAPLFKKVAEKMVLYEQSA